MRRAGRPSRVGWHDIGRRADIRHKRVCSACRCLTEDAICLAEILERKGFGSISVDNGNEVSYCPLHTNHPASANNLAIFADCPHCFNGILKPDFEAIGNLRVWIRVCCIAKLLEVFNCNTVFIWGVAKNDNVEGFSGLVRSSLRCLRHRGIKVRILHTLSDISHMRQKVKYQPSAGGMMDCRYMCYLTYH